MLRGWLVHGDVRDRAPLIIYFGGSGSESSHVLGKARLLAPWSVAMMNYRGFGQSTGEPTPGRALADALLVYDRLIQRPDVDASRIVVMGYSLGTGMAVHLAGQRPTMGVVLFAPYDSLKLVNPGQSAIYDPLQPMMKRYFASIDIAPQIDAPLLVLVGSQDVVFPPEVGRRLAGAWGGPVQIEVYEGEGHTMSEYNEASWQDVKTFLEMLPPHR
jgi:pimeloyl-ACP methyl ester carboxylesterase